MAIEACRPESPRNRGAVPYQFPANTQPPNQQTHVSSSYRPVKQDASKRKVEPIAAQTMAAMPRSRSGVRQCDNHFPSAEDAVSSYRGACRATSPRDDRRPVTGQMSVGTIPPPEVRKEEQATLQLTQELEDVRKENSRLQDKLNKARNLMLKVQQQADDLRAERDRESLRAERLQKTSQQVMRQLKKETARVQSLEQQIVAVRREKNGQGSSVVAPVEESPTRSNQRRAWVPETEEPKTAADINGWADCVDGVGNEDTRDAWALAQEVDLGEGTPPRGGGGASPPRDAGKLLESGFAAPENVGLDFERSWEFVVQGQHVSGKQDDFAAKTVSCYPDDAVPRAMSRGVASVCSRGRRLDKTVPNQDDFVVARHTLVHGGHIAFYGVFDGHGPAGHHCAAFVRSSLPENLFGQRSLLLKPEETLREAFRQTQATLLEQPFETHHSGTTALVALVLSLPAPATADPAGGEGTCAGGESWLFVAHVGDSRAILASHRGGDPSAFTVTALTNDHRPDDADEAERVRQNGGEVRKLHKNSGAARVFAPGRDRPGLALTRCFGASGAAEFGVTAEPEVSAYRLRLGVDVLLVLGTDGLFEFCSNTHAAGHIIKKGVTEDALGELCEGSRQQWSQSSFNETVDDITCIAAALPLDPLEGQPEQLATNEH